jgi:hypothetical protein
MPNHPALMDICAKGDSSGVEKRQHRKSSVGTGNRVSLRRQILCQLIQQNVTFHIKRLAPLSEKGNWCVVFLQRGYLTSVGYILSSLL